MTSLTKRLTSKGTGQAMEYKEELVHNVLAAAHNAIVSVAKKVKDNVLHVMTMPVIMLPSAMPKTPAANPPGALPKVPNALVIKYVYIPTGRLKVAKPWPEPTKAQKQQRHQPHISISVAP